MSKSLPVLFLSLFLLLQATNVFALDLKYPSIPGALAPQEIEQKYTGKTQAPEKLPAYFNYFIRLFFVIAIGIAIAMTLFGGFLYLFSGFSFSKVGPAARAAAIQRISQGFLGLFIIIVSYLILGLINPQLLVFKKLEIKPVPKIKYTEQKIEPKKATLAQVSAGTLIENILNEMKTKTKYTYKSPRGVEYAETEIFQIEVPFLEAKYLLGDAKEITSEIRKLLKKCKCGKSLWDAECVKYDGLDAKDCGGGNKTYCENPEVPENNTCENKCETCGGVDCPTTEIKEKRDQLQQVFARLETVKTKLFSYQVDELSKTLGINAAKFLLENLVSGSFAEDAGYWEQDIKKLGYEVAYETHKTLPNPVFKSFSPLAVDPFTFYAPLNDSDGLLFSAQTKEQNQRTVYESERFSLFAVLARLSLEEINGMINDCVIGAFGNQNIKISEQGFASIIEQTFHKGMASFLADYLAPNSKEYADAFYDKLKNEANVTAEKLKKIRYREDFCVCMEICAEKDSEPNCNNNCKSETYKNGLLDGYEKLHLKEFNEIRKKCEHKDASGNLKAIDIKPLSDILIDTLFVDVKTFLPDEIEKILDQELRNFVFNQETNKFLNQTTYDTLKYVLGGALSATLEQMLPKQINELLAKKLTDFMPETVANMLRAVDRVVKNQVENFQKNIEKKTDKFVDAMAEKMKSAVEEQVKELGTSSPQYDIGNLDKTACCEKWPEYWYDKSLDLTTGKLGTCRKMEVGHINALLYKGDPTLGTSECPQPLPSDIPSFCDSLKNLNFCWDASSTPPQCIDNCHNVYAKDWQKLLDFRAWGKDLAKSFFTALLSLPQKMIMALFETAKQTAKDYAHIWVEDEFIIPLQPHLSELSEAQKALHKNLSASVKDLLPQQTVSYLQSNIGQAVEKLCKGDPIKALNEEIKISEDVKKTACDINNEFKKSLLDQMTEDSELGRKIRDTLKTKVLVLLKNAYCGKDDARTEDQCILDYLDKTLAEILWPEIAKSTLVKIIKGTPKEMICGELITQYHDPKFINGGRSASFKCDQLKTTKETVGLLPYLDKDSNFWKTLVSTNDSDNQKAFAIACPFVWYMCENPLSVWGQTIGNLIANIINTQCDINNNKVVDKCERKDCDECEKDKPETFKSLPDNLGIKCKSCETVKRTLAYSLIKFGMEKNYQPDPYTPISEGGPVGEEHLRKQKERATYQWLYVGFDLLRPETKKVALTRGFTTEEWKELVKEIDTYSNLNELPSDITSAAQTFILWLTEKNTLYDILTDVPLGIIKPSKQGEATLLREAGQGSDKEFLFQTPYNFLRKEACGKIISDFKKDYPDHTIEKIMAGEYKKLANRAKLPYSVESLEKPSFNQAEQILLSNDEIELKRKGQYLTCLALDKEPSILFGLDQELIYYIYPKEYRVLFQLFQDKLKPDERPQALNKLLFYLFNYDPARLISKIGKETGDEKIKETSKFLNTTMGQRIEQSLPNEKIIEIIFEKAFDGCNPAKGGDLRGPNCPLYKKLSIEEWQKIQEFLLKTPLQLIKDYLTQPLIDHPITKYPSVMNQLAKNSVLGKPYFDTLGRVLHLDKPIKMFYLAKEEFDNIINKGANAAREAIQNTTEKIFKDYPQAGLDWLRDVLSSNLAGNLSKQISDKIAGTGCRNATADEISKEKCDPETFAFKDADVETKTPAQCCDLGASLVCEPRCRLEADRSCDPLIGEVEETNKTKCYPAGDRERTNGKCDKADYEYDSSSEECCEKQCCFAYPASYNCPVCREATINEANDKKCNRDKEERYTTVLKTDDKLCCRDRYRRDNDTETIFDDKCCVNVMECILNKFTTQLEIIQDVLLQGPLLNSLK